ncbi:MAG: ATP-dependent DNA ligase [Gemmatimonadetes bacterium]|nr:ATP-dependent DNA ligase [Gemmatimonadota bacterium]
MNVALDEIVETSRRVAATMSRLEKIEHLAGCLRRCAGEEVPVAVAYLSGELPQGRIGIGYATIHEAVADAAAGAPLLTLVEVDAAFSRLARVIGPGSTAARARLLRELLARATREEQAFLVRLLLGELRQGALEGITLDAIARAADVSADEVRRAFMLAGDLGTVARAALAGGVGALAQFGIRLFRPLQPMLAQAADDIADALSRLGAAAFEYKLDGARVQVHKGGEDVRVFTRRLNDVTAAVPEIVELVRALAVPEIVLDGEAIALRPDGAPHPFQTTMRRFGRKLDVERMRGELPLTGFFFDCLYLKGVTLIDRPEAERFEALAGVAPPALVVPRRVTGEAREAESFLDDARRAGHEGLIAKALEAPYEAGRRGQSWLKIKPAHTLDLVVLAAEWGHGRRRGWLSNLHLGARNPETGGLVMLGKTFKGMTDELLEWQTQALLELEVSRDPYTVRVRPELVIEVAFNEVQASPRYPGGLALRFARVKGYRPDKRPEEADTIDTVRRIFERSH